MTEKKEGLTQADVTDAFENYLGYCSTCKAFTRDETEPDAFGYYCPECGEHTVMGSIHFLEIDLGIED